MTLATLGGIAELSVRIGAVRDRLDRVGAPVFVASLDALARDAAHGITNAASDGVMLACALWLAMVENPFTPTRIAMLLLPTCRSSLAAIAKVNVHPRLRELGAMLQGVPFTRS